MVGLIIETEVYEVMAENKTSGGNIIGATQMAHMQMSYLTDAHEATIA